MSEILFENPLLIGTIGTLFCALTAFGWIQTGNAWARNILGILIAITLFLVWLNIYVKTDREIVSSMIYETAKELEANEIAKIERRIHPVATESVKQNVKQLPSLRFLMAKVNKIHNIEIQKSGADKVARVRMNVTVELTLQGITQKIPQWVQLDLEEKEGNWLVVNFENRDPQYEFLHNNDE